jgi:chaperonin GroEL (HSP60 family)
VEGERESEREFKRSLLMLLCVGQGVMIVTNTGRMIITNSGKIILKHIAVEHPIARYIVDSLQAFHARYGDGCVSLILCLHACIESVCRGGEEGRSGGRKEGGEG